MLMLTLPTQPIAVRLRTWRALKALGCAALRDGADLPRFTHIGVRVRFEVLMAGFVLDGDARLQRLAATVRYLDAGGIPTPEAAGLESVLAGQSEVHADDDALAAASTTFDALYAAPGAQGGPS